MSTLGGPEESARLLGLSFRSHMASHPLQFTGQEQITGLAHIHGKGPHKGVNAGRHHWEPALAIRNTPARINKKRVAFCLTREKVFYITWFPN